MKVDKTAGIVDGERQVGIRAVFEPPVFRRIVSSGWGVLVAQAVEFLGLGFTQLLRIWRMNGLPGSLPDETESYHLDLRCVTRSKLFEWKIVLQQDAFGGGGF